ncbi:MAG: cold shock domain-containing protein [Bacteroidota bacterium]
MAKSQQSFGKKEREKKRLKKKQDKALRKEERKANSKEGGNWEDMIAYVDEFGNITDTPPDPDKKKKKIDASSIVLGIPKKEEVFVDPIKKGKIDFFNDSKGFGFIKEQDTQEKYFVHINGLIDKVVEGDKVTFELEQGMKGMNAVRVKKA